MPTALANHFADISLEELDKVLALPDVSSQVSGPALDINEATLG